MKFRTFVETTYYHQTTPEAAELILKNGIDVTKQQSGLFPGFFISPYPLFSSEYYTGKKTATLVMDIDEDQIMDVDDIKEDDLTAEDEYWGMMGSGWKNTLITRIAKKRGYNGVRNGKEVILFNDKPINKMERI